MRNTQRRRQSEFTEMRGARDIYVNRGASHS